MLIVSVINNEEKTVYTVPEGREAFVYVDIYTETNGELTVKINDVKYWSGPTVKMFSIKLVLSSGATLKVGYTGRANVFIYGLEV